MKPNTCKYISEDGVACLSPYHSKMYHKPRKEIKRSPIKQKTEIIPAKGRIKRPRKKSTPRALAKKKAWDAFSLYVRTRDCIRFTGDPTQGMCVTCKALKPRSELQAGHFVGGRGNAVLFDERLVYSQDGYCNQKPPMGLGGNYAAYTLFMFDEGYSREEIEGFLALKGTVKQYKTKDFEDILTLYRQKLADLLA